MTLFHDPNTPHHTNTGAAGAAPQPGKPKGPGRHRLKTPRLAVWMLITLVLLAAVFAIAPQQLPVSLYKLSLVTLAAVVGYWIDRSLFPYARPAYLLDLQDTLAEGTAPVVCDDDDACTLLVTGMGTVHADLLLQLTATSMLRRAIIVGCAMLAMGLGA